MTVLLSVDFLQFDGHIIHTGQSAAAEEIRRGIIWRKKLELLICDYRRKLLKVTDHQELHPTEGLIFIAETSQDRIYGLQKVTSHHAYLIYDKYVHGLDYAPFLFAEGKFGFDLHPGDERMERKLEERMYRHATGVYSRYACRGHDHYPLSRLLDNPPQECSLARTGLSGQKDTLSRLLHELPRGLQFIISLHSAILLYFLLI